MSENMGTTRSAFLLAIMLTAFHPVHAERVDAVPAHCTVIDQIIDLDRATLARIKPLMARRSAIAERRVEIAEMGASKRGLQGTFNRNYSSKHLDQLDGSLRDQISLINEEYEFDRLMLIRDC